MKPEKLYLNIINNLNDGVYFVDIEKRVSFWNKAAEEITGYKNEDILGKSCRNSLINHIDINGNPLCLSECPIHAAINGKRQHRDDVFLRHRDGYRIPVSINIFPVEENNVIIGAAEIFTPNSPVIYEDDLIEKLSEMTMSDPLTGTSNRRKTATYLEYKLHELKRFQSRFCVVLLDIDNFASFNEAYGHDAGDEILRGISKSIKASVRKDDLFGRWGDEEFIGVFDIRNNYEAKLVSEKLRILIESTEISFGKNNLSVTASLGVTIASKDDSVASLVGRANTLMLQSKQNGKNLVSAD